MELSRTPRRGQRVQVEYHVGQFIVTRVDKINSLASLELWDDPRQSLRGIPFEAIHLIRKNMSEAA